MALPTSTGGSLAFRWGPSSHEDTAAQRIYYEGFSLSGVQYTVGTDCVFLLPEEPGQENYVGRLVAAFARMGGCGTDAYSIEVRWFERLQNRELVELEETDVNPTGCLAGVATVLMADSREQAERMAAAQDVPDNWFYCRGIFKQLTNEFVPYSALSPPEAPCSSGKRRAEDSADSGDARPAVQKHTGRPSKRQNKGRRQLSPDSGSGHAVAQAIEPAALPSSKCQRGKGPGQQCIECGATQTPQWREGPAGPKTLCNACGVRYNRLRANRRGGSFKQFHGRNKGPKAIVREPVRSMTTAFSERAQEADQLQEEAAPLLDNRRQQQRRNSGSAGVNTNGRPVRQAALASASRTAAIARLGVLAEDDDDVESDKCEEDDDEEEEEEEQGQACARVSIAKGRSAVVTVVTTAPDAPTMAAVAATSGRTGRDDRAVQECSLDSSRSAQGRLQAPTPTPTPAPVLHELQALHSAGSSVGLPDLLCEELQAGGNDCTFEHGPSSPNSTCGPDGPTFLPSSLVAIKPETSTDVGTLLQHDTYLTAEPALPGACPAAAANVLRRVALRAVGFCPDAAEFGEVFSSLEALQSTLPEDAMQQLVSMAEQVDAVAGEAAAAEAALQAVAQVLAARQKAADASRERAVSAVEKLKYCMSDLVQQHSHDTTGSEVATHAAALALAAEVLPSHEFGHMLLGLSMDSKLDMVPVCWDQHSLDHEPQQLLEMEGSPMLGLGMLDSGAELLCLDGSFGSAV